MSSAPRAPVVAVLAPTGRDAEVAERLLERDGFEVMTASSVPQLSAALGDRVGAVVIAEEALGTPERSLLLDALSRQPPWSDVPVVVLTGEGELAGAPSQALAALAERVNLTLLERPVRRATFVTTLRAALRARSRQIEVRDHLNARATHERNLLEARQLAEVANDAKMRFLATMSHELRTPLNAIAGYAELMLLELHGPLTPEQRTDLQRIDRSQRYLLSLINDILNFAKLESGEVAVTTTAFPIERLLRELESYVAPQIAARGVQYSCDPGEEHCLVCADEEKVQQIMLNLLSNALKFTPHGGRIAVTCRPERKLVCIRVTDSGSGVPVEKREKIFEPFVQLDRGLTSTAEGTGLGLSISRELARRMGGELWVDDAPGGGARFSLTLPRDLSTTD